MTSTTERQEAEEMEKEETEKCQSMRRAFGLIVSDDPEAYDCSSCELEEKGR